MQIMLNPVIRTDKSSITNALMKYAGWLARIFHKQFANFEKALFL